MQRISRATAWLIALLGVIGPGWAEEQKGVVAHYSFEEGTGDIVKDWSGSGNKGVNHGAEYVHRGAGKGCALRFATGEAYVDCGNGPSLNLHRAVTVELWFYPETVPTSGEAGLVGTALGKAFLIAYSNGTCWWYVPGGSNYTRCFAEAGSWHHIVATFDEKGLKIYRDGRLENSIASALPEINQVAGNLFLRYPVIYGEKVEPLFKCMMDEVRIYNRVLSENEILDHYKKEANHYKEKAVTDWIDRVRLIPHVYPIPSALVVEADFTGLKPIPAGTSLYLELWDPVKKRTLSRNRTTRLPESGKVDWRVDLKAYSPGRFEIRAAARNPRGGRVGLPSTVKIQLPKKPPWLQPERGIKVLNNFVTELLNVKKPARQRHQRFRVTNPRNGWIYIASSATVAGGGEVSISLASDAGNKAVIIHRTGQPQTQEAMRHFTAGEHTLDVFCEGNASLNSLVVRAIPEILYAEIGYANSPYLKSYGRYTMEYLKRTKVLDSLNVLVVRDETAENKPHIKEWLKQGKRLIDYSNLLWMPAVNGRPLYEWKSDWGTAVTDDAYTRYWSERKGMLDPRFQGIIVDEVDANYAGLRPGQTRGMKEISQNPRFRGKSIYAYCVNLYAAGFNREFVRAILDADGKLVEELYLAEQPTTEAARETLNARLTQNMLRYQELFPDCQKEMILNLGYFNSPPESLNVNPAVDWKVWMDMQFNLIANSPVFSGLYGLMAYHSFAVDDETQRWTARLYRHYCIEGHTEMLARDPYVLPHIKSPDFADGTSGWTLSPAEEGSMEVKKLRGLSTLQGRAEPEVASVLWTRRSAARPNRISQAINALQPGRLYSLKILTADHKEFVQGKSVKQDHVVSLNLEGVELVPDKCLTEAYPSSAAGHSFGSFTGQENPLWITYRVLVFRAKSREGQVTISDWASEKDPGGPIGQELMSNFIEVQPYLDD
ncbi:MAG: LamG domain-containing protein [Armatimonadetes bacterium]|nr:LamG domain-containing protein [Armatimonadota bacterium]